MEKCIDLPAAFQNKVASLQPDPSAGTCTFYSETECRGSYLYSHYPGLSLNTSSDTRSLTKYVNSLQCVNSETHLATVDHSCEFIDGLTVWLKVGNGWFTGTWSKITYTFGNSKKHVLGANAPRGGSCIRALVDLQAIFGSAVIPKKWLNSFKIFDIMNTDILSSPALFGGDQWQLQGFRLDARCANSAEVFVYQHSVNRPVYHNMVHWAEPTIVYSVFIHPYDWIFPVGLSDDCDSELVSVPHYPLSADCDYFDRITLEMQLGRGQGDGTWDTLTLGFNEGETHHIVSDPDAGFHTRQDVNLQETFNSSIVAVSHLQTLHIQQIHDNVRGDDNWRLRGLVLQAKCARSDDEYYLVKYAGLDRMILGTQTPMNNARTVWSGSIDPTSDWKTDYECSHIDHLRIKARLQWGRFAGTNVTLILSVNEAKAPRVTRLGYIPLEGIDLIKNIDFKHIFGRESVPIDHIRSLTIYAKPITVVPLTTWYKLSGLTLYGQCAGTDKQLVVVYKDAAILVDSHTGYSKTRRLLTRFDWRLATERWNDNIHDSSEF
ncbi:hypothetical protein CDD81_462 [Ophiocordyceps australis]|uniref:Uncharacterized protein n=1 Tax=Ophiocordyceps australis TaxID=1399860 RepID=A0A2C5XG31_9HYPO|nr:hypothetical protein CDD81_462 [Ophiocordyceps australis]